MFERSGFNKMFEVVVVIWLLGPCSAIYIMVAKVFLGGSSLHRKPLKKAHSQTKCKLNSTSTLGLELMISLIGAEKSSNAIFYLSSCPKI